MMRMNLRYDMCALADLMYPPPVSSIITKSCCIGKLTKVITQNLSAYLIISDNSLRFHKRYNYNYDK